ncbi:MAG: RluA family pseudouridine synthase [Atopobiaceae bacterium]
MRDSREVRPYRIVSAEEDKVSFSIAEKVSADALLAAAGVSKTQRKEIFAAGRLQKGGDVLAAGSPLAPGDAVTLVLAEAKADRADAPEAAACAADILFEDPFLLVADKPAGILVHSDGTGAKKDTLTARVRKHLLEEGRMPSAQAVQRLDEDTTGCVIFSLVQEFQGGLDTLVAGHGMEKLYLACVRGSLPEGPHVIAAPLGRDRHDARRMRVSPSGKDAKTTVWGLIRKDGLTLALVSLGTGRKHQIRVHLATEGHPILGDPLYGMRGGPALPGFDRLPKGGSSARFGLELHCWRESFVHPVTGEAVSATAPVPESFCQLFGGTEVERALARWESKQR